MQNESYIVYDLLRTLMAEKQNEMWDQTWCVGHFSLVSEVCMNNSYAYILAPLQLQFLARLSTVSKSLSAKLKRYIIIHWF